MLKVFNTLTGRKEPFEPLTPGQVRMYVCGVTVYDDCHLGHARSAVVFDVIRHYLKYRGFRVKFVKNFTDVDDKIINRANQLGIPWQDVTRRYIDAYYRDMRRLGVRKATKEPRATKHMTDIIKLIKRLLKKRHAYRLDDDVYYEVKSYRPYGCLSRREAKDLLAGARIEVDERKRNPMDFALWKSSKPGEPKWRSPWGLGRPGWHIECSAMSMKHLGSTFDIHGGGMDLIFPHHENEIAQSCGATGKEFARYWIHNGFVQINQEKMSKSLGNFFTIKEIFEKFQAPEKVTAEVVRYFLLSTKYRSPIDFSDEALRRAWAGLDNFYNLFLQLEERTYSQGLADKGVEGSLSNFSAAFERAMDDDFNTPATIARFQGLRGEINTRLQIGLSQGAKDKALKVFHRFGQVLGLFEVPVKEWKFVPMQVRMIPAGTTWVVPTITDEEIKRIESQIEARNEARRNKDFAGADFIRKALAMEGITLEDKPDGTTRWKR